MPPLGDPTAGVATAVSRQRARAADYAGAAGRVTLAAARELGSRWVVQPKRDGVYARVCLSSAGRIAHVLSRTDRQLPRAVTAGLLGAFVGWPHAELVGELEAYTERGNGAAAARGHRLLHLFDCVHDGRRSLRGESYRARRDTLWRMQSEVVNRGLQLPWARDRRGVAHDREGRFCAALPTDWRLAPIVPQLPAAQAERAWADWVEAEGGEGLVLVHLEAPLGRRGAKKKCKPTESLDCRVLAVGARVLAVEVVRSQPQHGGRQFFVAAAARGDRFVGGELVEIACEGWYRSAQPRFPRLVRGRPDLAGTL